MITQLDNLLLSTKVNNEFSHSTDNREQCSYDTIAKSFNMLNYSDDACSLLRNSLMTSSIQELIKILPQIEPCNSIEYESSINPSDLMDIMPLSLWENPPITSNLFSSYNLKKQTMFNNTNTTKQRFQENSSENQSKGQLKQKTFNFPTASYMDTKPVYLKRKNNQEVEEDMNESDDSYNTFQNSIYNVHKKKNKNTNNYNKNKKGGRYAQRNQNEEDEEEEEDEGDMQPKEYTGFKTAMTISNKVFKNNNNNNDQSYNRQNNNSNNNNNSNEDSNGTSSGFKKFVPPMKNNNNGNNKQTGNSRSCSGNMYNNNNNSEEKDKDNFLDEKLKGFDKKMIEFIQSEILSSSPNVNWDDIAGLEFAKKTIKEIIIWPLLRPDLFNGIRRPPKGLLLFGPPGTGKTMIAKAIASQSHSQFFNISASSLMSKWIGESEKLVRTLFALASFYQPSVVFIDEIDSILTSRSENECEASRRIKTEFLVQLDGAGTNAEDRILIIGATNRPQEIDDAFIRRLSKRLYIPLPNKMSRRQLIQTVLKKEQEKQNKYEITEEDIEKIISMTKGYSGSDMISVCREAAMMPIRSIEDISNLQVDQLRGVNANDFLFSIENVKPSVSEKTIGQYVQWNQDFGSFQFEDKDE